MDEPLSNLDAKLRTETRAELVALHQRLSSTFVYVTHDQVEAMTMGAHVAVMSRGRIEQVGTPQEVYARPATVFVAQFIGTPPMNIFPPGMVEPGDTLRRRPPGAHRVRRRVAAARGRSASSSSSGTRRSSTATSARRGSIVRVPAAGVVPHRRQRGRARACPSEHRHRFDAIDRRGGSTDDAATVVPPADDAAASVAGWPRAACSVPSAVILGLFVLYPLGRAVWLGARRCDAQAHELPRRTACASTSTSSQSDEFRHSLWVTVKFALLTVPVGVALGVGLAVLADRHLRGIGFFRTVFSSTVATSVAVASLMWLFLLQPSRGVLANVGWIQRPDAGRQEPRAAAATRARR